MRKCLNIGCGNDYRQSNEHDEWINIDVNVSIKADRHLSIFELPMEYGSDKFDYILAQDVIEHTENPQLAILNLYGLLKKNGKIQIQTPDPYALFEQLRTGIISELEYNRLVFSHEATNQYERHYHLISVGELQRLIEFVGFKTIEKKRLNICAIVIGEK